MSLYEELIEYSKEDENIIKSFKPKENLCDTIFEKSEDEYLMKDDIRKKLVQISNHFMESISIDFFIHDVVLTGSLANYNWSEYSDVDLHIVIDFENQEYNKDLLKDFFDAKKNVWNEKHEVKIKNFDVEIYVQDVNEYHVSSGVYSVLNNKWIIKPDRDIPSIDDRKILEKSEEYVNKIDLLVKQSQKEDVSDKIELLRKKLKSFRQCGLDSGGEHSYENLTFKLLRRNGYIKKLLDLKTSLIDKKLSVAQ